MNGMMDQQTLYLLDENDTILLSGGSKKISEERLPKLDGTSADTHMENGAWLVRNKKLEEGGIALVSIVPRYILMQKSGKIIREMFIFYVVVCGISFVLLQFGARPFLERIRKLDTSMEAVDQGILEPISVPECRDELGRLTQRYNKMVEQIQHLLEEQYVLGKEKSEAQLYALQAQISPHFLYNTLDSIQWMCERGKTEDAAKMVSALARLFRISISKGRELIPIKDELRHAENYLLIQSYRYKDQFTYSFDVDESLCGYLCNKITVQPLIENAIYHGLDRLVDEGEIKITVKQAPDDRNDILITVSDNGVGMTKEQCEAILKKERSDSSGIGVKNVNDRLKIYFGDKYGLTIESELDVGTSVTVRIPKQEVPKQ